MHIFRYVDLFPFPAALHENPSVHRRLVLLGLPDLHGSGPVGLRQVFHQVHRGELCGHLRNDLHLGVANQALQ